METGLQSEDLKFFQELIGKRIYIYLKSNNGRPIMDKFVKMVPFVIISIGKKFIKARNDNNGNIIIVNIDDIAFIYEDKDKNK